MNFVSSIPIWCHFWSWLDNLRLFLRLLRLLWLISVGSISRSWLDNLRLFFLRFLSPVGSIFRSWLDNFRLLLLRLLWLWLISISSISGSRFRCWSALYTPLLNILINHKSLFNITSLVSIDISLDWLNFIDFFLLFRSLNFLNFILTISISSSCYRFILRLFLRFLC